MSESGETRPSPYLVTVSDETKSSEAHFSPSAARNIEPIMAVLAGLLPDSGRALEIASGTGQHVVAYAMKFPAIRWTPSDPDSRARASIAAWIEDAGLENADAPLDIDLLTGGWQEAVNPPLDVIIATNVVHISPWEATLGLLEGAARALKLGGLLFVYSCFMRDGRHLSESNIAFDRSLRSRNPAWGVRDTRDVSEAARERGLDLVGIYEMPANNLSMAFRSARR